MVRDGSSARFAEKHFNCPVYLVPDAALSLRNLMGFKVPTKFSTLRLARTDKERVASRWDNLPPINSSAIDEDWAPDDRSKIFAINAKWTEFRINYPNISFQKANRFPALTIYLRSKFYVTLARKRLNRGLNQLSKADYVETDRLHGHILCFLMGKPHLALDNETGKVSEFRETWNT